MRRRWIPLWVRTTTGCLLDMVGLAGLLFLLYSLILIANDYLNEVPL